MLVTSLRFRRACEVLFVRHLLQPIDRAAIKRFGDGDVGHGRGWGRAMPVLVARRAPDYIARPDLDDRLALALGPSAAGGDDQRLAEWVGMPGAAGAGLEGDVRGPGARRGRRTVERVDPNHAGEVGLRPLLRRLRSRALE